MYLDPGEKSPASVSVEKTSFETVRASPLTLGDYLHSQLSVLVMSEDVRDAADCIIGNLDENGYLTLVGRLKELINRGGEKVSPREVDEILMDHPAVAQVVCFGMPHPKLGEEVAAAVVLREGQTATERDLQAFVSSRAAEYKVPKKILILDEIPKGATGKLQRIGLAAKLGLG